MRHTRGSAAGAALWSALTLAAVLVAGATITVGAQSPGPSLAAALPADPCASSTDSVTALSSPDGSPVGSSFASAAFSAHPSVTPSDAPTLASGEASIAAGQPSPVVSDDCIGSPSATPRASSNELPRQTSTGTAASTTRKPGPVKLRRGVAYMARRPCAEFRDGCINRADIYYPSNAGPWPVIVAVHGRPRTQKDMRELSVALAAKGAVVFNVDYRGVRPVSKGFPEAISDVACAVRYARQFGPRYGGDRDHLVLVGHSMGGYVGAMVSLAGDTFKGAPGSCKSTLGMRASLPNGFVSVAGVSAIHHDYRIDQTFLGGTYQQIPKVWKRATLYTHIGRKVGHNHRLQVGIIFERHDPFMSTGHATSLHTALRQAGYDSHLILLDEGTTHFDILDMDLDIGRRVVRLVWRIVRDTDLD